MAKDSVDQILEQWSLERPDLDTSSLSVVVRLMALYKPLLRQATKALEPLELELWQYDVLSALRRQGKPFSLSATRLAESTGLSTGAMTNRIDKLEALGFVRRTSVKSDRRSVRVGLTIRGLRVIERAMKLRFDAAEASLKGLSSRERQQLADLLRKVVITTAALEAA